MPIRRGVVRRRRGVRRMTLMRFRRNAGWWIVPACGLLWSTVVKKLQAMKNSTVRLRFANGWTCLIEVQYNGDGAFGGRAEVMRHGVRRCVLVALKIGRSEDALKHLAAQACAYMDQTASAADGDD